MANIPGPAPQFQADALITSRLFRFIDLLRANGFTISASDIKTAHMAINDGALCSEDNLQNSLRSIFCQSKSQWQLFPVLFKLSWSNLQQTDEHVDNDSNVNSNREPRATGLSYFSESLALEQTLTSHPQTVDLYSGGASDARTFAERDFRFVFNPHDMRHIERIVDDIARRLQKRLRRRARQDRSRGHLDLRKTARTNLQHNGWMFDLYYRRRQKTPARFLLLLDVSQSMEVYSYLFLRFARGLVQAFKDTDAYAFHTDLIHISDELRDKSTHRLEARLQNLSSGWLGGTRIAESLKHFNQLYAKQSVQKDTIIIVFSDGYDSGDPEDLVTEVLKLKALSRKVVWVNPLLGRGTNPEPLPIEKSLYAVLPHLDLYTSAHNINSLKKLEPAFRYR